MTRTQTRYKEFDMFQGQAWAAWIEELANQNPYYKIQNVFFTHNLGQLRRTVGVTVVLERRGRDE
jgi:hypothetical protein